MVLRPRGGVSGLPRRGLLAGVAALVTAMLGKAAERPAAAAHEGPFYLGFENHAEHPTRLIKDAGAAEFALTVENRVAGGHGIQGKSSDGTGVEGSSSSQIGVIARSASGYGLLAESSTYAALFYGTVYVTGHHIVQGGKYAAVKAADGSNRLLHAVEAPEAWFEDIGRGQLVQGKASIALDRDFAGVVVTQDYHVFLTPKGETRGLFVSRQTPAGFEVQEQGGGTSSVAFDYRVVARRKDLAGRPRLERITLPDPPRAPDRQPPAQTGPRPR